MEKSSSFSGYRPDIDGLRALAVLAVIAFHFDKSFLPGGFVGVDIFFVLSGYLITGVICYGIENDSFSFLEFYRRRIKRILPAYVIVSTATLFAASFLLIPNDYIFYTTSLAASWVFVSNVFFSMLSWGYFGQRTEEFPLLHTWSLAVEEQFYFVFPLLLLLAYRYFKGHVAWVVAGVAVAFLILSQSKVDEIKSYFLITTRAHELMIGSLVLFSTRSHPVQHKIVADVLAVAGLSLIAGSLFFIDRNTSFPGVNSLYPCLGTALLIHAGARNNITSSLLCHRVVVFIGLISYSLYLWHWPVLALVRYRGINPSGLTGAAAVVLIFILSVLTWKYIENPARYAKTLNFKKSFAFFYAVPAIIFVSIGGYSYLTDGAPRRFPDEIRELISSYSFERDLGGACAVKKNEYRKIEVSHLDGKCVFGANAQNKPQVMLFGDSHANHFKPFVEGLVRHAGMSGVYHVQGTCLPFDLYKTGQAKSEFRDATCQKRNADLISLAGNYRYVVLAGFWSNNPRVDSMAADMAAVVQAIIAAGSTPVVFKDNAYYEPDRSQCILRKRRGWISESQDCSIPLDFVKQTQGPVDMAIDGIQARYPELLVVDPKRIMCNSQECVTYMGNTALYKDGNHINSKAAAMLSIEYIERIGNPFQSGTRHPQSRADGGQF